MITFNIHSSYNYFRFSKNKELKLNTFISGNSIFSIHSNPANIEGLRNIDYGSAKNWEEKMLYIDTQKKYFNMLSLNTSDYFIIDFLDERFNLIKLDNGSLITNSSILHRSKFINLLGNYVISNHELSDEHIIYDAINYYIENLMKYYNPEQIIINEVYPVLSYISKDTKIHNFDEKIIDRVLKMSSRLDLYYSIFKDILKGCHSIKMLPNTFADEGHISGLSYDHFEEKYYDYFFKKLNLIVSKRQSQKNFEFICDIQKNHENICLYPTRQQIDLPTDSSFNELDIIRKEMFSYNKSLVENESIYFDINNIKEIRTGRYNTDIEDAHFEIFANIKKSDKLIIILGAGQGKHRIKPRFIRWSWYPFMDGSVICIEDPMYYNPKFQELKLGWFFGDANTNYREYTRKLVEKLCDHLNIVYDNLYFYSSSGGGTVSIHMASMFKNSTAIAINPQLDIRTWEYAEKFQEIVNVDLYKSDPFERIETIQHIKKGKASTFLIIFNIRSDSDRKQLYSFCNQIQYTPKFGIQKINNIVLWVYDAKSRSPHTAFEDYILYFCIMYLANLSKKGIDLNAFEELYLLFSEIWYNNWYNAMKTSLIKNKTLEFVPIDEYIKLDIGKYSHGVSFKDRTNEKNAFIKIFNKFEPNLLYKLQLYNPSINTDKKIFSVGIFDFTEKKMLSKWNIKISNQEEIVFKTGFTADNIGLVIFNGEDKKTFNNILEIESIELYVIGKFV